jgi:membrane protein DedA with SNARE-associated domain
MRNLTGFLMGASGMPLSRFLPVSAAAATLWALTIALEYHRFGRAVAGAGM